MKTPRTITPRILPTRKVRRQKTKQGTVLTNLSDQRQKVFLGHPYKFTCPYLKVTFTGKPLNAAAAHANIRFFNLRRQLSEKAELNATTVVRSLSNFSDPTLHIPYIFLPPRAKLLIKDLRLAETTDYQIADPDSFQNDVLIITPMYPSDANPYAATFVASKVTQYKAHHIKSDILIANSDETRLYSYNFDGDTIHKVSFDELRNIIQRHHYKKILVHFLNPQIGNALRACDLDGTDVLVFCHGVDVDFWNLDIYSKYFSKDYQFSAREVAARADNQRTLEIFNTMPNVTWIFNTKWNYLNSQKATGLSFTRHKIIPCVIDETRFPFTARTPKQRTKILVIKKMNNERQYAVDIAVKTILALSEKPYFPELEFTIVGAGDYQAELVSPLRGLSNVHIIDHFIDNRELGKLFAKHGILLAPSRYDTQGVTTCEAALSGMAVIASTGTGLSDIIPESQGAFFSNDDIPAAVNLIEQIYLGKKDIAKLSHAVHDAVLKHASSRAIQEEIALLQAAPNRHNRLKHSVPAAPSTPLLSIIVPAYNAAQYLENGIKSLVAHRNAHLLEILIIDDGSTDDTAAKVRDILAEASPSLRRLIKYIKKPNGGHGSTINKGLELATGKYLRIMDADDRMDSEALANHLDYLAETEADIVFTNTMHDLSIPSKHQPDHKYDFMTPHRIYPFDELCREFYGFPGYGVVLSTVSIKTDKLRASGCHLTEKCFYVDMEFNYYATLAADTAALDPVDLYYYYLGRSGQSLATESYMKNFDQYLKVSESLISLIAANQLSPLKRQHFCRIQLAEVFSHQYKIALDMYGTASAFRKVEKMMKAHPAFYNDRSLVPPRVFQCRRHIHTVLLARTLKSTIKNKLRTAKHFLLG